MAIALFQLVPLSPSLLKLLSPKTLFVYEKYIPFLKGINNFSISIFALSTIEEIIKVFSLFAVFFITINVFGDKKRIERLLLVIILWAVCLVFYGVARRYLNIGQDIGDSFSTFGNRNHFAAYMVMVAPLAIAYSLSCKDKVKKFMFISVGVIISAGVFLSFSRAGSVSLILSLLLMMVLLKKGRMGREKYWVLLVMALGVGFVLMVGFDPMRQRFILLQEGLGGRLRIARDSLQIVKDFPVFGVGLGNFSNIFTLYRNFISRGYYYYAHNDHLQIIVEMGFVGAAFYFCFIFKILKDILDRLEKRHDIFVRNIVVGGVSGSIGLLIHSFFEFNFHIPAVALLFWIILGLTYKTACSHFKYNKNINGK